jgi:hypothetical protein
MIHVYREKNTVIKNFSIYGERHSGTNFLESTIRDKFNLPITWDFGWKHFFGFTPIDKLYHAKNTLFIGIVRNPYDWIKSMFIIPHNLPRENKANIEHFTRNIWYSIDYNDNEIMQDRDYTTNNRYDNIFCMRSSKLKFLYNTMPRIVSNYLLIRFEDLITDLDTHLTIIKDKYHLSLSDIEISVEQKNPYHIEPEIIQRIADWSDWKTESKFYYYPR